MGMDKTVKEPQDLKIIITDEDGNENYIHLGGDYEEGEDVEIDLYGFE